MARDPFYNRLKRLDALHGLALRWPWSTLPLRFLSYVAYRGLEVLLGGRHPHGRVLAQARRMEREGGTRRDAPSNPKVLFFTMRGWFAHVGTEAILAKAMERRGARVRFFLCSGSLPQCDFKPGTDPHVTPPLCWRCKGFGTRLLEAFGLTCSFLDDWIEPQARQEASRLVAQLSRDDLEEWRYRDLRLYDIVRPSVQRSLLRGDVGMDDLSQHVLRGFLESAVVMVDAIEALLDQERPDVVLMTNGLFFSEAILLDRARRRGIEAITYERGIPVGTVLFERNKPAIRFDVDRYWDVARTQSLSEPENQELDDYLLARSRGNSGVIDLWPTMQREQKALVRRLHLDSGAPTAVLFTNVLWDSAVYGRDVGFDGMFDWVNRTIELFSHATEYQLVVRIHPAEVRIPLSTSRDRVVDRIHRRFPQLPSNVRVVTPDDPASSYTLIDLADAVLVYTSTIGLESAVSGRPVVVAGRTHYGGRGFTLDVPSRRQFEGRVQEALQRKRLDNYEVQLARRYAYLFFHEFMQPFPWLVDTPRSDRTLTFSALNELDQGQDGRMDRLCRAILEGGPFVVPGEPPIPRRG